ncbi:hypothetical protein HK102_000500 [Quaeritorhiza haematococci]|nr:hypothetical protein HK102_000500 [Quaeritorhiza haematococci]
MAFSGAVVLTDLNDYIAPSQACIKPVEIKKDKDASGSAKTEIRIDDTGGYYEVTHEGTETKLEKASITLNDSSGCITSAESVLITMQSHNELYQVLEANTTALKANDPAGVRTVVISVSPQSRASIAAKYNIPPQQVHQKMLWFFKQHLGVNYVFDTAFSRDFALIESAKEFVRRYKDHVANSMAADQQSQPQLPMLASACPGWICYAEKTHPYILPHISTTKSPQQIMGSLVKSYFASKLRLNPDAIYHVSVMPCYDKKLEASRQDFYNDVYRTRDVDCVITTGECERMFVERGVDLRNAPELPTESLFTKTSVEVPLLVGTEGSSSGGYLSYIMRYAAYTLFNISLTPEDIEQGRAGLVEIRPGRNADFKEVALVDPNTGKDVLKFAAAYGFRNIQNLVRKVKVAGGSGGSSVARLRAARRSAAGGAQSDYHFVEVMACPSGCINGGGQLKPDGIGGGVNVHVDLTAGVAVAGSGDGAAVSAAAASREWVAMAERAYKHVGETAGVQGPEMNPVIGMLYSEWLGGEDTPHAREMLHTQYHAVEKTDVNALAVKW